MGDSLLLETEEVSLVYLPTPLQFLEDETCLCPAVLCARICLITIVLARHMVCGMN